ncbi:hypothetical protein A7A08_03052 [Methyloligella halotolerans]|uniref:Uncharacterized protein n=1 Tax=Methyloligella halotolerans TaxID=1177755 RepID=A0A1E2RVB8_9HYPH|nr:hypothetical protein [Methyloligella halotolerans]ODA66038.1 hypothetical protein A7A08_03052 [Methyloligella halotolerans]
METPVQQPTGKVKANFVRILPHDARYQRMTPEERRDNDRQPLFRGTISSPEKPDEQFEFAVWDYIGRGDKPFLAGPVRPLSTRAGVEDHLAAARMSDAEAARVDPETGEIEGNPYELNPNTIVIRLNNAKTLKPEAGELDAPQAEANDRRPLYWLKWQRGSGEKEVRGSLWDRAGRYGPFLDGTTQYPLSREEAQALTGPKANQTRKRYAKQSETELSR